MFTNKLSLNDLKNTFNIPPNQQEADTKYTQVQ